MTTPAPGYDLVGALMGLELPRNLVERAHLAAQKALLAQGFAIRRELRAELSAQVLGHVLSAGALAREPFTGQEVLLRTDLFMTTVEDSYGCAYLSWDLHFADDGPVQAAELHEALGVRHVWEGRGVDPRMPAFDAQRVLLTALSAACSGAEAVDFDGLATEFVLKVSGTLTL